MLDLEEQISNMKIIHVAGTKGKVISYLLLWLTDCLELKPSWEVQFGFCNYWCVACSLWLLIVRENLVVDL